MEGTALRGAVGVGATVSGGLREGDGARAADRLRDDLMAEALRLGFSLVGVARPAPSGHMPFYESWIERGLHGEMEYLARDSSIRRRRDLSQTMEAVRSVLVVAHEHYIQDDPATVTDPSRGIIARYARGADYHRVVGGKLRSLARWLDSRVDGGVGARAYVDTGPILERDLGRRAGLGWFGRNTMLIHPRKGSYFFLGTLLVDVPLEPSVPFGTDHCGSCRACLDACPTGALLGRDADGAPVMDARRCISYLTIEHRGVIPEEVRPLMGNRIYGCDICQEVCPFNVRFAEETTEPRYAARGPGERPLGVEDDPTSPSAWHPGTASPSLVDLLSTALDEDAWESFSRGSAIRRAGRAGFARNVCVALGNWSDPSAVSVLSEALADPEALVRGHAAWALGQIGSPSAVSALEERSEVESDSSVRAEISRALSSPKDASLGS